MVIYSSDSGLILVVCSLLIECLLATLIWYQNLVISATQLTPSHLPSHFFSYLPSHLTSQYVLILVLPSACTGLVMAGFIRVVYLGK